MYNEYEYWNERAYPTSRDDEYTEAQLQYIGKHILGVKRLLDFGPGVGRIFPVYKGIGYVEGYDISTVYRERALKVAVDLGLNFIFTLNTSGDPTQTLYDDKWFNVAVACTVLLHQRPTIIVLVMRELARIAKKVVVVSWMDPFYPFSIPGEVPTDLNKHCFHYDYPKVCKEQGWAIDNIEHFKGQIFFTYAEQ